MRVSVVVPDISKSSVRQRQLRVAFGVTLDHRISLGVNASATIPGHLHSLLRFFLRYFPQRQ
jgi:hypothetical protein